MFVIKSTEEIAPFDFYVQKVSYIFKSDQAIDFSDKAHAKRFFSRKQAQQYIDKHKLNAVIEKAQEKPSA